MSGGSWSKSPNMYQPYPSKRLIYTFVAAALAIFVLVSLRLQETRMTYLSAPRVLRSRKLIDDVFNNTLGFEKIFVVGLPTRSDRRDGMVLQAALSNIKIEFIDGVLGKDVPDKAIPQKTKHDRLSDASIGSWRAHINAIREVVHRNLSSALILEDDVDWDIRIRHQLFNFARSSHALIQPLSGSLRPYVDPTYPTPLSDPPQSVPDFSFNYLPTTVAPEVSPYGDEWDLLWLGHCGMSFPFRDNKIPKGRVIQENDETTPQKKYLWSLNQPFTLVDDYPEHTRAVHHAQEGVCSLGYAISQRGAQKLLHAVGLGDVTDAFDILLRFYCEGAKGRKLHNCLAVQPTIFSHHRPAGPNSATSDIGDHGDGFRENSLTDMIRWSVRINADRLMAGETTFWDQFPDNE